MQVKVYRELSDFSPKVVGPLTLRQFIACVVGLPVCYFLFTQLNPLLGQDVALMIAAIPGVIMGLVGWAKPYGMYIEAFVMMYVKTRLLPPHKRKYIVKNKIVDCIAEAEAAEKTGSKKSKPAPKSYTKHTLPQGAIL